MWTPNIPGGTRSMSKTINRCGSSQGICGLVGVSETCSTLHQQGCSLTVSRGHCPVVPTSFVDFPTTADQFEALDFRLGRLIWKWKLIKLVTWIPFWYYQLIRRSCSGSRAYGDEGLVSFKCFWAKFYDWKKVKPWSLFQIQYSGKPLSMNLY